MKNTRTKNIIAISAVVLLFALAVIALCVGMQRSNQASMKKPLVKDDASQTVSQSVAEDSGLDISASSGKQSGSWKLLTTKQPSALGTSGILENRIDDKTTVRERRQIDRSKLNALVDDNGEGIKTASGHQIYQYEINDETSQVILSGYRPVTVQNARITDTVALQTLRKEDTCDRVYLFHNKDAFEAKQKSWDEGAALLKDEAIPDGRFIIVNGCLISDIETVTDDEGSLCVPIRSIATRCVPPSVYDDVYLFLTVSASDNNLIQIPSENVDFSVQEYLKVNGDKWTYDCPYYPQWSDEFCIPVGDDMLMPVSDVSRIFGWKVYTCGNAVHIVTDDTDYNDNFILQDDNETIEKIQLSELEQAQSSSVESNSTASDTSGTA
ncbi:MAG: hypothetical protein RR415_12745 [Ruthenibacterium sp.]